MNEYYSKFRKFLDDFNIADVKKTQFMRDFNDIIKEYTEKSKKFSSIDEFNVQYGHYFDDKFNNLINQVKEEGKVKNNNNSRGNGNSGNNSKNSSGDDLDIDDYLSGSIAIKYFEEHVYNQEKVVDDLRVAVNEAKLNSRRLIKELKKQEAILEILKEQSKSLSKSDSYGENRIIAKNDDKLIKINDEIRDKLDSLKVVEGINNRHVKREKLKLQRQIARLKKKQGKIMARQSKITNKKLISDYKRIIYSGNKIGKDEAVEIIREQRNNKLDGVLDNLENKNNNYNDKMMQARDDGKFIKEKLYSVPVNISQAKFNLLDKYCKLLRLKDGKVDGFRKLPDAIKEYIEDNMHINNDNLVVAGGKIR